MLNSFYDEIIYGKNYLSLSYALARLQKKKSVLLIDDKKAFIGNNWCEHLGLVEVHFLQLLGVEYNIHALKNIHDFLSPYTMALSLDENIIELGRSSLDHLNELARKLPECFSSDFIHKIASLDREYMDELITNDLKKISKDFFENKNETDFKYASPEISNLCENFLRTLDERSTVKLKELYLSMQMIFQTYFSNKVNTLEAKYLLSRLLSPLFKIDTKKLCEALTFELRELGGSLKETSIKEWEFYQRELSSVLLNSYEGIIATKSLKLFTGLDHHFPFDVKEKNTRFYSLKMKGKVQHSFMKFYKNQRIIFTSKNSLGTDFPYAEVTFTDDGIEGIFAFADYPGTKASFHLKRAREYVYERLEKILPGLSQDEWFHNMELTSGGDVWSEDISRKNAPSLKSVSEVKRNSLFLKETGEEIKFIDYFGPLKVQTLGILGYLVEIKKAISA